jgi:hypothetical protein
VFVKGKSKKENKKKLKKQRKSKTSGRKKFMKLDQEPENL